MTPALISLIACLIFGAISLLFIIFVIFSIYLSTKREKPIVPDPHDIVAVEKEKNEFDKEYATKRSDPNNKENYVVDLSKV